jgi:hypothetical protein
MANLGFGQPFDFADVLSTITILALRIGLDSFGWTVLAWLDTSVGSLGPAFWLATAFDVVLL